MNLSTLNRYFDRFVYKQTGLDIFIVSDNIETYRCNVIVYPEKFLKNASDFSPRYYELLNNDDSVIDVIESAFRVLGMNTKYSDRAFNNENTFSVRYILADDLGKYLNDYIATMTELMGMYGESDYGLRTAAGKEGLLSGATVTVQNIFFDRGNETFESVKPVRIRVEYDYSLPNNYEIDSFGHYDNIKEYLSNNMEWDEQIYPWFYSGYKL